MPDGLAVHVDGMGIFGGFDQKAEGPGQPGAPVLRIKGAALFGGVEVKRKPRRNKSLGGSDRPAAPGGVSGRPEPSSARVHRVRGVQVRVAVGRAGSGSSSGESSESSLCQPVLPRGQVGDASAGR